MGLVWPLNGPQLVAAIWWRDHSYWEDAVPQGAGRDCAVWEKWLALGVSGGWARQLGVLVWSWGDGDPMAH